MFGFYESVYPIQAGRCSFTCGCENSCAALQVIPVEAVLGFARGHLALGAAIHDATAKDALRPPDQELLVGEFRWQGESFPAIFGGRIK